MTVFCGKGGTGKTCLSLALGLCHALRGRSTVVVTSHPLKDLAAAVSLAGLAEWNPGAAEKLFVIHVDAAEVIDRIVSEKLPAGIVLNAVLRSGAYRSLIEVAPGLKEIALLNKLKKLSEEKDEQGRRFERVVWDAPATGHFLQTLRVSRSFETYLSGPFAMLGAQVARFTADAQRFAVTPVCTLEEMAVQETIEMCGQLEAGLAVPPKNIVCNMTSPLAASPTPPREVFEQLTGQNPGDVEFLAERNAIEQALFRRLRDATKANLRLVHRSASWGSDLDLLRDIARQIEPLAEASL